MQRQMETNYGYEKSVINARHQSTLGNYQDSACSFRLAIDTLSALIQQTTNSEIRNKFFEVTLIINAFNFQIYNLPK